MNGSMLPRPRFWAETGEQMKPRRTLMGELMTFMLLYFLSAVGQGLVLMIPTAFWMFSQKGRELLLKAQSNANLNTVISQIMSDMPDWLLVAALFAYGVMGITAIAYCRSYQKRSLSSMGLRGKPLGPCLMGWSLGLGLFLTVMVIGLADGAYRLAGGLRWENLGLILAACLGCLVQGASEELLLRGYLQPTLGLRSPPVFTLIPTVLLSSVFQGGSLFSLAAANAMLLSLFLCLWVIKRGELWSACALHGAWIFGQGFLLAYRVEDTVGLGLVETEVDAYRSLLTGGIQGPAGSLGATIVLLAAVGAALAMKPRDPAPPQAPKDGEGL